MSVQQGAAPVVDSSFVATYMEVQQFYAQHMQLLDAGAAEQWAATFTEDGTFKPPSRPEAVVGRAALAAGVRDSAARLAAAGETHRHLVSMASVRHLPDGAIGVRSYAQVIATDWDGTGSSRILYMCVCDDVLVRQAGGLRVRSRTVTRDDLP